MEYLDFYDIAKYGNTAWKGGFSEREIANNAYEYYEEFRASSAYGVPTPTMIELCKLLVEDGTEESLHWAYQIASELGMFDMDFMDTDGEIICIFLLET